MEQQRTKNTLIDRNLFIICPNCEGSIVVSTNEINCSIFRHGIFKSNSLQIPPHSSEINCTKWINNSMIYGCGKPFKIVGEYVERCAYI